MGVTIVTFGPRKQLSPIFTLVSSCIVRLKPAIKLSPIVGYGANDWAVTTMDNYIDNDSVSPNGLSIVPVFWGIPMAILFFILLLL